MRIAAAAVALACVAFHVGDARALTACPISEFNILFAHGDAQLDEGDLEIIEAGANRARQCNIGRVELIVEGDLDSTTSLSRQRATAVAASLIERRIPEELVHVVNEGVETYGTRNLAVPEAVKVLVLFD